LKPIESCRVPSCVVDPQLRGGKRARRKRESLRRAPLPPLSESRVASLRVAQRRAAGTAGRGHPITRHYVLVRHASRRDMGQSSIISTVSIDNHALVVAGPCPVTPHAPAHNGTLSDAPARPRPPPSVVHLSLSRYQACACSPGCRVPFQVGRSARHGPCRKACTSRAALRSFPSGKAEQLKSGVDAMLGCRVVLNLR